MDLPSVLSDIHAGEEFLASYIFVHLKKRLDKFNLLVFMCQKLYAVVDGLAAVDNEDTTQHHEVLLPGHLLAMFTKEKLQDLLLRYKEVVTSAGKKVPAVDSQTFPFGFVRCSREKVFVPRFQLFWSLDF